MEKTKVRFIWEDWKDKPFAVVEFDETKITAEELAFDLTNDYKDYAVRALTSDEKNGSYSIPRESVTMFYYPNILVVKYAFVLLGLVSVRADLNYQQGLNWMWSRQTRYDFYWPALSHIGEQRLILLLAVFIMNRLRRLNNGCVVCLCCSWRGTPGF